jgi:hypothetical protein
MPSAIGQDEKGNLLVANLFSKSIGRFAPAANGNVSPGTTIQGVDTTLDFPDWGRRRRPGPDLRGQPVRQFDLRVRPRRVERRGARGNDRRWRHRPIRSGRDRRRPAAVDPNHDMPDASLGHIYHRTLQAALGTTPYR